MTVQSTWFGALAGMALLLIGRPVLADPDTAVPLPGDHLHPESISVTDDGTAYVGSMNGGVLRVSLKTGKSVRFIAPGAFGSGALYGVLADRRHGILWTCNNEFPGTTVNVAGADPGHWVKGFDLATGKGRISLRLPGEHAECNDFAVGADGSVYIADSGLPQILRWRPGARALEVWFTDSQLGSPDKRNDGVKGGGLDGIVFGTDGAIYINNYYTGALFRVTVGKHGRAGTATRLTDTLGLPDGMRPLPGGDMVVADGKGRVLRLALKGDAVTVTPLVEGVFEPSAVGYWGGRVWYTGAQFGSLFAPDKVKAVLPFKLTPVRLSN